MVAVYVAAQARGFEFCYPVKSSDFEVLNAQLNGVERGGRWRSPPMQLLKKNNGELLEESDAPWLKPSALVFRSRAVREMGAVLADGELLPLSCAGDELVVFNVTRVIDALDEAASEILRFKDGSIMTIASYVFRSELLGSCGAFKIPNMNVSHAFLSQQFVDAWRERGLRGLDFRCVWSG